MPPRRWILFPVIGMCMELVSACGSVSPGSLPPSPVAASPSPSPPNFEVYTTDWQCATPNPNPPPPCLKWRAHAIVKNYGGKGQALLRFFVVDNSGQYVNLCTAVVPQTPTSGISEASCETNMTGYADVLQLHGVIESQQAQG